MSVPQSPEPLPPAVVDRLVGAGLSYATAISLDRWKAQELVELLRLDRGRMAAHEDGPRPALDAGGPAAPATGAHDPQSGGPQRA